MDSDPERHEQNMARWIFAGSLGVVFGPLLLGGMALIAIGWRSVFGILAVLAAFVLFLAWWLIPEARDIAVSFPSRTAY